jgi:LPS O-antigen subunit length determinant protein (WzzB/FepE family)
MTLFPRLFKLFILVIITPLFVTGVFLFYYQNHSKKEVLTNYLNIAQISSKFIEQNIENTSLRFDFINDITPKLDKNKKAVQNNEISPFAAAMSLLEQYFNNDR